MSGGGRFSTDPESIRDTRWSRVCFASIGNRGSGRLAVSWVSAGPGPVGRWSIVSPMGGSSEVVGGARRILITGLPGSGKSTVGRLVAAGIERSAHIDADLVRESIVGGFVHPDVGFTDEFIDQIRLQREIVNLWVERMVTAGYTAVIDDAPIPPPPHLANHYAHVIDQASTIKVVLKPSTAVLHERLTARRGPFDEMFLQMLDWLDESIGTHDFSDWDVIDSTNQTPDVTAAAILDLM